jgi:hypothetical protein
VTEQKQKKDEYQKALAVFGQAMKDFHKGEMEKAAVGLKSFIEKFPEERELVDRARIYIAISTAQERGRPPQNVRRPFPLCCIQDEFR